jgi:hypothetical protein
VKNVGVPLWPAGISAIVRGPKTKSIFFFSTVCQQLVVIRETKVALSYLLNTTLANGAFLLLMARLATGSTTLVVLAPLEVHVLLLLKELAIWLADEFRGWLF